MCGEDEDEELDVKIVIDDDIVSQSLGEDEEQEIDIVNVYHDVSTLAQLDVCGRLGARDGREDSSKEDFEEDP